MASKRREGGTTLKRFGECAVAMRNILQQDDQIGEAEFAFMDNHFLVLEMAYFRWKQKHTPHLSLLSNAKAQSKTV